MVVSPKEGHTSSAVETEQDGRRAVVYQQASAPVVSFLYVIGSCLLANALLFYLSELYSAPLADRCVQK